MKIDQRFIALGVATIARSVPSKMEEGLEYDQEGKIDRFILSHSPSKNSLVGYIGAANDDNDIEWQNFQRVYAQFFGCKVTRFYLKSKNGLKGLSKCDVLYLTGGDTFKLLAAFREQTRLSIRRFYNSGGLIAGGSAGANFAFSSFVSIRTGKAEQGLGLINQTFCPHYNRPTYREALEANRGKVPTDLLLSADDFAGFLLINGDPKICFGVNNAQCHQFSGAGNKIPVNTAKL